MEIIFHSDSLNDLSEGLILKENINAKYVDDAEVKEESERKWIEFLTKHIFEIIIFFMLLFMGILFYRNIQKRSKFPNSPMSYSLVAQFVLILKRK